MRSASSRRQRAMRAWSPDSSISGMARPSHSRGFVYWGYSSSPSSKLSDCPDSILPITPGINRTQASITASAAISPPEST